MGSTPLVITILLWTAAVATAYLAIRTARGPQGAVGWGVFILSAPYFGIPVYFLFGYANYTRTSRRRREVEAQIIGPEPAKPPTSPQDRLDPFEQLARVTATRGNGMELLIDGQATYDALVTAIGAAERSICLQFYTIRADHVGERFKNALLARARAGVKVWLLHDAFWGLGLPKDWITEMRAAGIELDKPRGPMRLSGPLQINFRSHRKQVIVDGRVGFLGGLNLGKEYLGQNPAVGAWRDTFLRLEGPMVNQLQLGFVADWLWASGHNIKDRLDWPETRAEADMRGLILSPGPTDRLESGNLTFCALAGAAQERLWLTSPYFVPDTEVMSALQLAALRGVEVRVLVPDRPDHWLPYLAAFSYFDDLQRAGGEIWRYRAGFLHQKVALVDDDLVSIGSLNLDIRSGLLNFEQTAIIEDRAAGRQVETMLRADFDRAERLETRLWQQPWYLRVATHATRPFAPLL